jgi:hypothetical protein
MTGDGRVPDTLNEMRKYLAEIRVAHENDAMRQVLLAFIAHGEKVDTYLNWLMAATGAIIALFLTQWANLVTAIGQRVAVADIVILMLALLVGVVAWFETHQAQISDMLWRDLPKEIEITRESYAKHVGQYFDLQRAAGASEFPTPDDMDRSRMDDMLPRLMPPDFNTGWRKPIWKIMETIARMFTGSGPGPVDPEWDGIALSAYRVGSAMWLIVFYQVLLIAAAIVGSVGLLVQLHGHGALAPAAMHAP